MSSVQPSPVQTSYHHHDVDLVDPDALWEQRFQETVAWLRAHPDGETPPRRGRWAGLAYWWNTQRSIWRAKKMLPARKRRLEAAAFPFIPQPRQADRRSYTYRLAQAKRFLKEHGHLRIPLRTNGVYAGLGRWAQMARLGGLPEWVREQLKSDFPELLSERDDCPWVHLGARARAWDANFAKLSAFVKRFGHANVPRDWPEDRSLAIWVYKQRVRMRDGRMTPTEYQMLKRVGFVFDPCSGPDPLRKT